MTRISRRAAAALAALSCAYLAACTRPTRQQPPAPAAPPPGAVRFLLVNDVYVADTLRTGAGGLARVAAFRDELERSGGAKVIFVLAGDVLSPSLLSKWYAGAQMVDAFNAARLDYATFGNHEFDLDRDALLARLRVSRFRWVSSNCTLADGTAFPGVVPWDTLTVAGVRVGIFGLTLLGPYRSYVRCTDPAAAGRAAAAALREAGAQLVVGLTHQELAADSSLLEREPGVDLILGGHEHEWHLVRAGGGRVVAKADANARSFQLVTAAPSTDGRVGRQQEARRYEVARPMPFGSATSAVAAAWRDTLVRRLGPERSVGTAPQRIDARDSPSRYDETPFGDLVADAIRAGTGADVALINSGALRLDDFLGPGPITNYQIESVFLFADETRVVTFPLTGARLRELLEHSVSDGPYGAGGFLQQSGARFRFDLSRPSRSRILGDITREGSGRVVAPNDTLRVSFVAYPACRGGDGYVVPEAAPACAAGQAGSAPRAADLLQRYLRDSLGGRIIAPAVGRMERRGAGRSPP